MKNGKKPTVAQRKFLASWDLNPADWLITKDTTDEMILVHRHSPSTTRRLPK